MRIRLLWLLLTCCLAAGALGADDLTVEGQWEGQALTLRVQVPYGRMESFDRNHDRRLSQADLDADRPGVRERLLMLLAVRSRGVTLRPKVENWDEGRSATHAGLKLAYSLPPGTDEVTLRAALAAGEGCRGRLNSEAFDLTSQSPEKTFRSFHERGISQYFLALGIRQGLAHFLFVLCLLLPSASGRNLLVTLATYIAAHSVTLTLAALGFLPARELFPAAGLVMAAGLNLARPDLPTRWPLALLFGLLQGLGLAGPLAGVQPVLAPLVSFTAGLETGLLLLVGLAWPVMIWMRPRRRLKGVVNMAILFLALVQML